MRQKLKKNQMPIRDRSSPSSMMSSELPQKDFTVDTVISWIKRGKWKVRKKQLSSQSRLRQC